MGMGPHQFDVVALNNTSADPRAKFPIGMPASSLDDACRALMQSIALSREDHMGMLVATAVANNVYKVVTNEGLIDPNSLVGGGAPAITRPFSLRISFNTAPLGMATSPLKLAIDYAAPAAVTRADGSPLVDGDIVPGKSYPIVGYAFTNGVLSQIRVISILPSEVNALADARVSAALPALIASIGSPVQRGGDIMTGALSLTFATPYLDLAYPGIMRVRQIVDNGGNWILRNGDNNDNFAYVSPSGAIWTKQLGDLNGRIESRGSAWADNAVSRANAYTNAFVQGARWVYAGQSLCWEAPGTGGFISPFGPQAMSCDYWTSQFISGDGQTVSAPFGYRYRNLQVFIPNQGWLTVGAVS